MNRNFIFIILAVYLNVFCLMAQEETSKRIKSNLEILDIETGERKVVYSDSSHFEAPNWSRDGSYLLFNQEGKIYTVPIEGGSPKRLNTGFANRCNNDHGISPDGEKLIISHHEEESNQSLIYILPITGGDPRLVTPKGPSYWHGWSPDGSTIAYCAQREGEYDVYIKPIDGGEEVRLTNSEGLDDGPDYSPDGEYIYYNSMRTGTMQIWRMKPDGAGQEQVTFDEYNDWFPHPSPDGKWLIFLSYQPEVDPSKHPANKEVELRMIPLEGGTPKVVAELFGGQGTINVPSWSPDSRRVAFVSYELLNKPVTNNQ